jgi:hypothetical protein
MGIVSMGLVSFALVLLGARLLRLSRRSGQEPERWLGFAFSSAGASAWLLPLAASGALTPETSRLVALAAQVGMTGAVCSFALFTWRVFRAGSVPARWLALGLIVANVAAAGGVVASGTPVPTGPIGLVMVLGRCGALLWLFFESAVCAQRARRRLQLGLADPILANRFLLWTIWTGALAVIPLFVLALRAVGALAAPVPGAPLPQLLVAVLATLGAGGAAAAVAVWLAFFPPPAYQRWVSAGAARAT